MVKHQGWLAWFGANLVEKTWRWHSPVGSHVPGGNPGNGKPGGGLTCDNGSSPQSKLSDGKAVNFESMQGQSFGDEALEPKPLQQQAQEARNQSARMLRKG